MISAPTDSAASSRARSNELGFVGQCRQPTEPAYGSYGTDSWPSLATPSTRRLSNCELHGRCHYGVCGNSQFSKLRLKGARTAGRHIDQARRVAFALAPVGTDGFYPFDGGNCLRRQPQLGLECGRPRHKGGHLRGSSSSVIDCPNKTAAMASQHQSGALRRIGRGDAACVREARARRAKTRDSKRGKTQRTHRHACEPRGLADSSRSGAPDGRAPRNRWRRARLLQDGR